MSVSVLIPYIRALSYLCSSIVISYGCFLLLSPVIRQLSKQLRVTIRHQQRMRFKKKSQVETVQRSRFIRHFELVLISTLE
ncbi:hypothetical protein ACWKT5_36850, partial [Streptomyces avermitilis]